MPVSAVPQDVFGVNRANEELEHELPMTHTEKDAVGNVEDSVCLSRLVAVYEIKNILDKLSKCCKSKAEAENGQVLLWVFDEFGGYISIGKTADDVEYRG